MPDPVELFRRQVAAFNAGDLDGFLATYDEHAVVHGLGEDAVRGHAELRPLYRDRFAAGDARCDVLEEALLGGRWVAVHERIVTADGTVELAGLFEVEGDSIVRADFSARRPVEPGVR
jgi:hypothetical protein